MIRVPPHYDFVELRRTPAELRDYFGSLGWSKIVAFQTRNPLHRAHEELTKRAAQQIGGGLLIHPVVGVTKPGDVDHFTRVRCYRALVDNYYEPGTVVLSLLPLAMRMAGPREVLLHAIIRRNYGCTHFIVGRDHAGPGKDSTGQPFYSPYAAQESMGQHQAEIGMQMVNFKQMVYLPDEERYSPVDEVPPGAKTADISGTEVREKYLAKGLQLPDWFSRPAVAEILGETNPPPFRQGLTIWFTGLSGSGKSTIAHALIERLAEFGRNCSLLDGDEIRTHLSKGLGFSKEDRDTNIRRVGYVAGLVAQHGGTTLCSVISPYRAVRDEAAQAVEGQLRRGLLQHPGGGLRAARRQGDVRQGPRGGRRGQADGLHRRGRSLRAAGEPRGHHRHGQALGAAVRRRDHREVAATGLCPAPRPHRRIRAPMGRPARSDRILRRPGRPDALGAVGPPASRATAVTSVARALPLGERVHRPLLPAGEKGPAGRARVSGGRCSWGFQASPDAEGGAR